MGRGRATATQMKVARELKYSSGNTDLSKLQAELTGGGYHPPAAPAAVDDDEDEDDTLYSKYLEDDDEDE